MPLIKSDMNAPQARQVTPAIVTAGMLSCQYLVMGGDFFCPGRLKNALGLGHLVGCAVSDNQELIRLERRLILHYTVFGNSNAVQPGAPNALSPPTTTAPSSAATIQLNIFQQVDQCGKLGHLGVFQCLGPIGM